MGRRKVFNENTYFLDLDTNSKTAAQARAKTVKDQGYYVRVIAENYSFIIFYPKNFYFRI